LHRKPDAVKIAREFREQRAQAVINRPAGADAQEARRSQVGSGRQGTAGAGSHEQDCRSRCLSRKPGAVKLSLAGKEPQSRVVMSKQAESEYPQEARRSQVGCGRQGTSDAGTHKPAASGRRCAGTLIESSWLRHSGKRRRRQSCAGWQGQTSAQEAIPSEVSSCRQGTAQASSYVPAGRDRLLRIKPDAIMLALAGREPQTQAVTWLPAQILTLPACS
jgi:hypothetical protein